MSMQKIITNFLTKAPRKLYILHEGIAQPGNKIQKAKIGLFGNIFSACNNYVNGIADMDEQFLQKTTSPYLFKLIKDQIAKIKQIPQSQDSIQNKFSKKLQNYGISDLENQPNTEIARQPFDFKVYPYVIFGTDIKSRIKKQPLDDIFQITRNRYIAFDKNNLSILSFIQKLFKNYVCGFRCEYINQQRDNIFTLTLEGNIETDEYYIVDLNNHLFTEEIEPQTNQKID